MNAAVAQPRPNRFELTGEMVDSLGPESCGSWLVTTVSRGHYLWSITPEGLQWMPLTEEGRADYTGQWHRLQPSDVSVWPAVGDISCVWVEQPAGSRIESRWNQSPIVQSIELVEWF